MELDIIKTKVHLLKKVSPTMNLIRKLEVLLEISREIFCGFYFNQKMKTSQIEAIGLEKEHTFFFLFEYELLIELR